MENVMLESLSDGVLTLTMNRPDRRNAINTDLASRLFQALSQAAQDKDVRAVVLTGAGAAFCAGGDVKVMADGAERTDTPEQRARGLRYRMEASRLLHEMPKPTIALIRGAAAGAGLSLALACDLRIATPEAKLTTAFTKVGLSGDYGGSYFLPRIVGGAKARELYLLSPVLSGQEALAMGLVTDVVPQDRIDEVVRDLAISLAGGPTVAFGYVKDNLNLSEHASLAEVFDAEAMRHIQSSATEDHREATEAFVTKRQPVFRGV